MTLALCHATVEPIHLGCTSIYIVYCVPFKRLTHLKVVECIFSTLTVVWIAVSRIHKNVLWSIFWGEFDLDYFGKYALEQLFQDSSGYVLFMHGPSPRLGAFAQNIFS